MDARITVTRMVLIASMGTLVFGCDPQIEAPPTPWEPDEPLDEDEVLASANAAQSAKTPNGKKLFNKETFDGNGRTCRTCHTKSTGALSPQQVQDAFAEDPDGPLFRALDSDDGLGLSYDRLQQDATIRVGIPLPAGWSMADDPAATQAVFNRGIPTTMNVPSLDDVFMADGRNLELEEQALGAINAHAEPGRPPTEAELEAIAEFQQTNGFFNNNALKQWANGGPPPELPPGTTDAEIRGREWIVPSETGLCGHCHAGPMLDETSEFFALPLPPGSRFFTAFVSELNLGNEPVQSFLVDQGDGSTTLVETPDPGRALITGDLADLNLFRIPTLWGVKDTAPYFHDNSAADLPELMDHYSEYFVIVGFDPLSEQDKQDIIAYMQLL